MEYHKLPIELFFGMTCLWVKPHDDLFICHRHNTGRELEHGLKNFRCGSQRVVVCAVVEKVQRVCDKVNGRYAIRDAAAPGQGGGVMDRPTIDKPTPGRESEFDLKWVLHCSSYVLVQSSLTCEERLFMPLINMFQHLHLQFQFSGGIF